jgi:hypothetical protein
MAEPLPAAEQALRAMGPAALDAVRALEREVLALPQVSLATHHVLHAGLYARTIFVPKDTVITGALIKVATLLVVDGDTLVYVGTDQPLHLTGHHVLPASAGRKQAMVTLADTHFTMLFATAARTVEEAEAEFTDQADALGSRRGDSANSFIVTGE